MFIEERRSAWRTPAGCYVGLFAGHRTKVHRVHRTPLGCGFSIDHVSINIAHLRCAITTDLNLPRQLGSRAVSRFTSSLSLSVRRALANLWN